jgi:AcrR family transcriptional regulator
MGRKGIDGSTITEIVSQAGAGVGTFYRYFGSKEELAREVFIATTHAFSEERSRTIIRSSKPVLAATYGYRVLIEKAQNDRLWASFIVNLEPKMQLLDGILRDRARQGLANAIKSGKIIVTDIDMTLSYVFAIAVATIRMLVSGDISIEQAHSSVEHVLRIYRIPEEDIAAVMPMTMDELKVAIEASVPSHR